MNSTGALQKREMSTARFSLCSSQVLRFFTESWGMREIGYRNSCKKSMLSGSILVTTHKKETIQTCPKHKIPGSTFRVSTSGATPSGLTSRKGAWVKGLMRWQMPASTVQKITGIHGDTIRSIHKQTMDEALVRRWLQISGLPVWRWTGPRSTRGTATRPA